MSVAFPDDLAAFARLPDTQVHDAYDADRDGVFARMRAEFSLGGGPPVVVPAFAMKERPGGAWTWRVRWSPRRPGRWSVRLRFRGRETRDGEVVEVEHALPRQIRATVAAGLDGPLVAPAAAEPPGYLRRLRPDGTSEAVWLFGACRAWVVRSHDPDNDWAPHEWLDRERELFGPMREGGFNLLNQWMAPWEFLIVHHDRAEFWRRPGGAWTRVPRPKDEPWTPYQCYDQGRARAFDRLLKRAEGDAKRRTVHLLLSPLPHQCLQVREHPWGSQESGWSPANDAGKQTLDRLNGLSGCKKNMSVWEFFEADPGRPLKDRRSGLFDHQANFFRYVIARWGASRALGVWVLVDELDAVGNVIGVMSDRKGWWGHPQCDAWLAHVVRLFRGELTRSDGMRYAGDPFRHPLHAATTSFGGQAGKGGNLEWQGGPKGARPDLFGWHWYPYWPRGSTWADVWEYTVDGVARYSRAPIGDRARLISEFGAPDRTEPGDAPSHLYPSLFHFAAWAAVFSGQAGTPMDWDDGKEFGELRWRTRKGIFHKSVYPVDHVAQLTALRSFLAGVSPDDLVRGSKAEPAPRCRPLDGLRAYALFIKRGPVKALGWLFSKTGKGRFRIAGLPAGKYAVRWYDPWTGKPLAGEAPATIGTDAHGTLEVEPQPVLQRVRRRAPAFPGASRLARGHDLAFRITAAAGP
jgi:hypothetical protein